MKQIGPKEGRTKNSDVNKSLELGLCEAFYEQPAQEGSFNEDYKNGVDCYVGGVKIQVKCNKDAKLYLEDIQCRNGKWYPGCVDSCNATYWLKASPKENDEILIQEYDVKELKELLRIHRKCVVESNTPTKEEFKLVKKYGGFGFYRENSNHLAKFFEIG